MLNKKYVSNPTALANYDYSDIASGVGYSIFYGANLADGTTSGAYVLTDNIIYSNKITTWESFDYIDGPSNYKPFDINFDTSSFNAPRIIAGDLIVSVPLGIGKAGADTGGACTANISGAAILYDGTTETTIATFRSTDFTVADTIQDYKVLSTKVPITATHFKPGEKIRIKIQVYTGVPASHTRLIGIGHDPQNTPDPETLGVGATIYDGANTTYGPTTMEVHVPFRIDA